MMIEVEPSPELDIILRQDVREGRSTGGSMVDLGVGHTSAEHEPIRGVIVEAHARHGQHHLDDIGLIPETDVLHTGACIPLGLPWVREGHREAVGACGSALEGRIPRCDALIRIGSGTVAPIPITLSSRNTDHPIGGVARALVQTLEVDVEQDVMGRGGIRSIVVGAGQGSDAHLLIPGHIRIDDQEDVARHVGKELTVNVAGERTFNIMLAGHGRRRQLVRPDPSKVWKIRVSRFGVEARLAESTMVPVAFSTRSQSMV